MDTLVRVKKPYIKKYFAHFKRILKNNGNLAIHLPCISSQLSKKYGFINLHPDEITNLLISNGFKEFTLDFSILNHGVFLKYEVDPKNWTGC